MNPRSFTSIKETMKECKSRGQLLRKMVLAYRQKPEPAKVEEEKAKVPKTTTTRKKAPTIKKKKG